MATIVKTYEFLRDMTVASTQGEGNIEMKEGDVTMLDAESADTEFLVQSGIIKQVELGEFDMDKFKL